MLADTDEVVNGTAAATATPKRQFDIRPVLDSAINGLTPLCPHLTIRRKWLL